MIGRVYFLQSQNKRYVFKIYRNFKKEDALQTIDILSYLKAKSYPVVSVVKTVQNKSNIFVDCSDGSCVGVSYPHI